MEDEKRINDCEFFEGNTCTWNDYYPKEKPCKFWINGKCTAKDEDLITEEEFEELQERNQRRLKMKLYKDDIEELKSFLINQIDQDEMAIEILKLSLYQKKVQLNIIKNWKEKR